MNPTSKVMERFVLAVVGILAAWVFRFYVVYFPNEAIIAPDSFSYLTFSAYRTWGYPLFVRLCGIFASTLGQIATLQMALTLGSMVFFSWALYRVFKSAPFAIAVGGALLLNHVVWWWSAWILTDGLFLVLLTINLSVFLLCVERPTAIKLVTLALTAIAALAVRPVGIFYFLTVPFLFLLFPEQRRLVLKAYVAPLVVLTLGFCASNWYFFDFFGLSKFAGLTMTSNTMYYLKPDTVTPYPELAKKLYEAGIPFRERLAAQPTGSGWYDWRVQSSPQMVGKGIDIAYTWMKEHPETIWRARLQNHVRFVTWLDTLSPLNRQLHKLGIDARDDLYALNDIMLAIAKPAYSGAIGEVLDAQWRKMWHAWPIFIHKNWFYPDLAMGQTHAKPSFYTDAQVSQETSFESRSMARPDVNPSLRPFNRMCSLLSEIANKARGTFWMFWIGAICVGLTGWRAIRRQRISPRVAVLGYFFTCLFAYLFAVCLAQIVADERYLVVLAPMSLALLFSPLLALGPAWGWARSRGWVDLRRLRVARGK